jgi:CheY-like chemotaxis protein
VPGINGIEVGTLIRKIHADTKIVFYSALRNESDVLEHFPLDEKTRFLQKPFKKEELFELIYSVMATKE